MGNVIERIDDLIKSSDKSTYKVSKDTGISQTSFKDWRSGRSNPKTDKIKILADYFGVSVEYLLNGNNEKPIPTSFSRIPVLGVVPCGVPIEAIEDIIEYIDVLPGMAKDHFGLYAKGDSMSPEIKDGDILIVKKTPVVESGKIAIVKVNGDDATCKKIIINGGVNLVPLNNDYDPKFYDKEEVENLPVSVVGEVVEIRRRLK